MLRSSLIAILLLAQLFASAHAQEAPAGLQRNCAVWLDHEIGQLHTKKTVDLCAETAGKVVLLINTASYCGYTHQFSGLETLYQRYKEEGLVLVGFPSDDFNQEDDDAAKTAEICYINYGVTFPMTDILHVKGENAHPVFSHLASETKSPNWNFNKYLVDRDGNVIGMFRSGVRPDSEKLVTAIEALL